MNIALIFNYQFFIIIISRVQSHECEYTRGTKSETPNFAKISAIFHQSQFLVNIRILNENF